MDDGLHYVLERDMFFEARVGPPRSDGLTLVLLKFGSPANNDLIVPDAIRALESLQLKGGRGILFDGAASLPVGMAVAHKVAHLYQFVACADPKIGKFVVVISHTPDHKPGDLLE